MSAARRTTYSFPHLYRADSADSLRRVRTRLGIYDPGGVRAYRACELPRRPLLNAIAATSAGAAVTGINAVGLTSKSVSWSTGTTAHNYLFALIFSTSDYGTVGIPSGTAWSPRAAKQALGGGVVSVYHCPDAAAQSTTAQIWTFGSSVITIGIIYQEYSGIALTNVIDGTDVYHSVSGTTITGGANATANAANLMSGAVIQGDETTSGAPTLTQSGGWVIRQQAGQSDAPNSICIQVALLEQIVTVTGTYTATVVSSRNLGYAAGTLATKAAGSTSTKLLAPNRVFYPTDRDAPFYE